MLFSKQYTIIRLILILAGCSIIGITNGASAGIAVYLICCGLFH